MTEFRMHGRLVSIITFI